MKQKRLTLYAKLMNVCEILTKHSAEIQEIMKSLSRPQENGCVLWLGGMTQALPCFTYKNTFITARRAAWFYAKNETPPLTLINTCKVDNCIAVDHCIGSDVRRNSKHADKRKQILQLFKKNHLAADIARKLDIPTSTVYYMLKAEEKKFKHLPDQPKLAIQKRLNRNRSPFTDLEPTNVIVAQLEEPKSKPIEHKPAREYVKKKRGKYQKKSWLRRLVKFLLW